VHRLKKVNLLKVLQLTAWRTCGTRERINSWKKNRAFF